ncbi:MAG: P22 phage major capsid protein family protein [Phycisphaerales bacterium]
MANAFVNGTQVASAMIGGLVDAGILINTVWRDANSQLQAGKGDTINIRRPATGTATNFSGTASTTDHTTNTVAVTLDHQPYEQVQVGTADKALKVEDFYGEIVAPRVAGIAEYLEDQIAATLQGTSTGEVSGSDAAAAVQEAYKAAGEAKWPSTGRYLACSPAFAAKLLGPTLSAADVRGDGGAALQGAVLGNLFGFTVIASSHIDDQATTFEPQAVAYHRTAVAAAFRTPPAPEGGAMAATASAYGMSARVVMDWSNSSLADVLTADTLAGFTLSEDARAIPVQIG